MADPKGARAIEAKLAAKALATPPAKGPQRYSSKYVAALRPVKQAATAEAK